MKIQRVVATVSGIDLAVETLTFRWLFSADHIQNPTGLTPDKAVLKYITGYLIGMSLSVDNIFVIEVIFKSFIIQEKYQHKVLSGEF